MLSCGCVQARHLAVAELCTKRALSVSEALEVQAHDGDARLCGPTLTAPQRSALRCAPCRHLHPRCGCWLQGASSKEAIEARMRLINIYSLEVAAPHHAYAGVQCSLHQLTQHVAVRRASGRGLMRSAQRPCGQSPQRQIW